MATNNRLIEELANQLRRRRLSLLEDIAGSQRAARALIEERGSEIEENAQKDRIASLVSYLNGRDQKMIQQIDATLKRVDEGTYGQCDSCEGEIGWERIGALPTATLCIDCATTREKRQRAISINRSSERLITIHSEPRPVLNEIVTATVAGNRLNRYPTAVRSGVSAIKIRNPARKSTST